MSDFSKLVYPLLIIIEKAPLANLGLDRIDNLIPNISLMYPPRPAQHPSFEEQSQNLKDLNSRYNRTIELEVELV